jgi:hypothetical protein
MRAAGMTFFLMEGQSPRYWYYLDHGEDADCDQFANMSHRFRKVLTHEFHAQVHDLLVDEAEL